MAGNDRPIAGSSCRGSAGCRRRRPAQLLVVKSPSSAALVDQQDDRSAPAALSAGTSALAVPASSAKLKPGNARRRDQDARVLQGHADEADPGPAPKSRRAVPGNSVVPSARITLAARYRNRAPWNGSTGHGCRGVILLAAAGLHAQQLRRALVEFMVADRSQTPARSGSSPRSSARRGNRLRSAAKRRSGRPPTTVMLWDDRRAALSAPARYAAPPAGTLKASRQPRSIDRPPAAPDCRGNR